MQRNKNHAIIALVTFGILLNPLFIDAFANPNVGIQPTQPYFSISAAPNSLNIQTESSSSSTITVTSFNTFNSAVTLSVSPSITGVTTTFTKNPVTPPSGDSASSTLNIVVGSSAIPGKYTLTVAGKSGSLVSNTAITIKISQH